MSYREYGRLRVATKPGQLHLKGAACSALRDAADDELGQERASNRSGAKTLAPAGKAA